MLDDSGDDVVFVRLRVLEEVNLPLDRQVVGLSSSTSKDNLLGVAV